MSEPAGLSIRRVAELTGVAESTLRIWEQRHGFPSPARLPSGHRRYSETDVEAIRAVEADRRSGVPLRTAVERAREGAAEPEHSIFAGLRRRHPDLDPFLLSKRTLIGMSHAMEDECAVRAYRPVLFAAFQRERHFRAAEPRWRELAQRAGLAVVLADFPARREPEGALVEVPIEPADPVGREWSLVCEAADYSACLSAWEPPGQDDTADLERTFEAVWCVEAEVVRDCLRLALSLAEHLAPELAERVAEWLERPVPRHRNEMRLATALTSRMMAYVGAASTGPFPQAHRGVAEA